MGCLSAYEVFLVLGYFMIRLGRIPAVSVRRNSLAASNKWIWHEESGATEWVTNAGWKFTTLTSMVSNWSLDMQSQSSSSTQSSVEPSTAFVLLQRLHFEQTGIA
ncbi:hypothetical protein EV2_047920 [Malus domestica]